MMTLANSTRSLRPGQLRARLVAIFAVSAALVTLRAVNPEIVSWFPLRSSCGVVTGLPCIFCGTTRAVHYLLHGEFARALYFNWLSFPVTIAALVIMLVFAAETALGRRVIQLRFSFRVTPQRAALLASGITALWLMQIAIAVGLHKRELLNPAGLLYALLLQ